MEKVLDKIRNISGKVEKLVSANDHLKEEIKKLRANNQSLKKKIGEQADQIKELEENMKLLKAAQSAVALDTGDKLLLKKKLSEFIRELDKSINLLSE